MLDLDALESFVASCESGSVSRAASGLFRSQPAVTRQIAALEESLGETLLERTSRGVKPTPAGARVLPLARTLLRDARSLRDAARTGEGPSGILRIAASDTVAQYWLAPKLGDFCREHPRVRLQLDLASSPEIAHRVAQGLSDVGFVLMPLKHPSLVGRAVLDYRHVAAFGATGSDLTKSDVTQEELSKFPLVLLGRHTHSRQLIEEGFRSRGLWPDRIVEVGNVSVQKELVRSGLGVGVLPDYAARPDDGLVYRPIHGASRREIALVTHKTDFAEGPAEVFVRRLLESESSPR